MIILQHDHFNFVANLQHFGRMLNSAPRHIGDVQQAVDAAEVDESAIVGDVLHRAFQDDALFEDAEGLFLERCALALEHTAARYHHVAARAIEFQDLETTALTDVAIEIARGTNINMRSGQERRNADIYLQAALDLAEDDPFNRNFCLKRFFELAPDFELLRLCMREENRAVLGFGAFEIDIDLVAFLDGDVALSIKELGERNLTLALVVDVDDDAIACDEQNPADEHIAGTGSFEALFHQRLKIIVASAHLLFGQNFLHLVGTFRGDFETVAILTTVTHSFQALLGR